MRLLVELAVFSFVTLLAIAVWLWRSLHRKPAASATARPVARAAFRIAHPRQDLAVGFVPPVQAVRRRTSLAEANPGQHAHVPQPGVRPDRAYSSKDFGDLSDPDLRKSAAVGSRRPGYVPESY